MNKDHTTDDWTTITLRKQRPIPPAAVTPNTNRYQDLVVDKEEHFEDSGSIVSETYTTDGKYSVDCMTSEPGYKALVLV